MPRTTFAQVAKIIEIDATITTDAAEFIETANALVTELCEPATDANGNPVHDATRLELIERWLAAHFYAVRDPRAVQERAGSVGALYESKVDLNLAITRYGQQAMLLDTSGALASLNQQATEGGKVKGLVAWLGKRVEDQRR